MSRYRGGPRRVRFVCSARGRHAPHVFGEWEAPAELVARPLGDEATYTGHDVGEAVRFINAASREHLLSLGGTPCPLCGRNPKLTENNTARLVAGLLAQHPDQKWVKFDLSKVER